MTEPQRFILFDEKISRYPAKILAVPKTIISRSTALTGRFINWLIISMFYFNQ